MKKQSPRRWMVPLFLVLCIAMGGSAQGIWLNMGLQLAAIGVVAWVFLARCSDEPTRASRQLMWLALLTFVLVAVQLVPLPPDVWTELPGRAVVQSGYDALGYSLPSLPISLTPYGTIAAVLVVLPAFAVAVATLRIRQREHWLAAALLVAVFAAVLIGALQEATGGVRQSPWHLYPISNQGAVGFFANRNHMGSLLLVSIPFAVAVFASLASRARERSPRGGIIALGAAALIVIAAGLVLNRSLAAVGLAGPVLLFSMLLLPATLGIRRVVLVVGTLALVGCVLFMTGSPISAETSAGDLESFQSRAGIWKATLELIRQSFPIGTGLGSFESIFPLTETPAQVQATYVNHAHNDYLELLLELGFLGALLIFFFFVWWGALVVRIWRSPFSSSYARAATIASGALLAHSVVDYPLRTVALSAIFAMCLGIMAQPRRERRSSDEPQGRPAKHLTIG